VVSVPYPNSSGDRGRIPDGDGVLAFQALRNLGKSTRGSSASDEKVLHAVNKVTEPKRAESPVVVDGTGGDSSPWTSSERCRLNSIYHASSWADGRVNRLIQNAFSWPDLINAFLGLASRSKLLGHWHDPRRIIVQTASRRSPEHQKSRIGRRARESQIQRFRRTRTCRHCSNVSKTTVDACLHASRQNW